MNQQSQPKPDSSDRESMTALKPVPVAVAASNLFGGDESRVWASIYSGELAATVLIEPDKGRDFSEALTPEKARKFMAGATEFTEIRSMPMPSIPAGIGSIRANMNVNMLCIGRRSSVMVLIGTNGAEAKTWPWGRHSTRLLESLAAAAQEHWTTYDPSNPMTAPKNETVANWLIAKRDVAPRVAEVIAQLLRADGLAPGPRKVRRLDR